MALPAEFTATVGRWRGSSRLYDPNAGGTAVESDSRLTVTAVAGDRFLRLDYDWSYRGGPQDGSLLLGVDSEGAHAVWVDSWHMGEAVLHLRGAAPIGSAVGLRGSYPAPPGPDWGWTIDLRTEGTSLMVEMEILTPDGQAAPAVAARYERSHDD